MRKMDYTMAVMLRVVLAVRINRASGVCGETSKVIRTPAACVADSGEGAGDAPKCASWDCIRDSRSGRIGGVGCGELHNRMRVVVRERAIG
ncbi:hypothetical protein B0H13DRAFT_2008395 [Mycena leptocephala]|nr:hypothetical protein B0H13DRAFT_2008395 [Mycena leptocephala]